MPRRLAVLSLARLLSIVDVPPARAPSSHFPWLGRAGLLASSSFAHSHPILLHRPVSYSRLCSRVFPASVGRLSRPLSRAMTTTSAPAAPHSNGTNGTPDESTQTNGFSEPKTGSQNKEGAQEGLWKVQSGMS
jgi:hypothetical protein